MTIGEYIVMRLEEEDLTLEDLDADTIDFFYQQWLINPTGIPIDDINWLTV